MVDSTAYERGPDAPSYSLVSGDRGGAARAPRSPAPDDVEGPGTEHASALLRMGALTLEAGGYSDAEDLFRRALEIGERALGPDDPALVPAMTSLASARIMSGKFDDAEPLVVRALAISENGLVEHDPDLAIVLNELARLCLKQSAHALAEPLLLRMLELKRSKGEDHPEVATVLASLATVRQALGRHESAEQLWRRVLDIRERTLAPNHFALATALEHLGEACAARGKIGEALQLFKRAQTIRELTLGAGHASLRISRDRIADLQLQAEGSLDAAALEGPAPAPERYRLLSADNHVVSSPPPARERTSAQPRKNTARAIELEPITKAEIVPAAPASRVAPPPAEGVAEVADRPQEPAPVNFRDVIMSIRQELEDDDAPVARGNRAAEIFASGVAALKERQKATLIGVAAIAVLVVLATVSSAWSESGPSATVAGASLLPGTLPAPVPSGADLSTRPALLATDSEKPPATSTAATTPVATSDRVRVVEQRSPAKKAPDRRADPTGISIPKMSSALAADFDSVVRARGGSARGAGESLVVPPLPEAGSGQRLTFDSDDPGNARQSAQLIGSLPTPLYPAQLRDVQGEVRVRFDVDPLGRPVMSSLSVVNSPNTLMTAAVLKVIPGLRFVPARSGGADSKAIGDVVQLRFQFRPNQ